MKDFSKTFFPDLEKVPDCDESSCSESSTEDDSVKREKYRTKEDQDVAVFMALAERLSLSSLLHLLQGHARTHLAGASPMYLTACQIASSTSQSKASASKALHKREQPQLPKVVKKFRFAEISNSQVRAVVHEIPTIKDEKQLWWSEEEMRAIRGEAIKTVKYFRKFRPEFTESIEILAESQEGSADKATVEMHMKKLTNDSYARGFETHIVNLLSRLRKETVKAVLAEQTECRHCEDSYDVTIECLREQSIAYSGQSQTFAAKIAECDQVEALKAQLSTWVPEPPSHGVD